MSFNCRVLLWIPFRFFVFSVRRPLSFRFLHSSFPIPSRVIWRSRLIYWSALQYIRLLRESHFRLAFDSIRPSPTQTTSRTHIRNVQNPHPLHLPSLLPPNPLPPPRHPLYPLKHLLLRLAPYSAPLHLARRIQELLSRGPCLDMESRRSTRTQYHDK